MARDSDHLAGDFEADNTGGFLSGFLAEEEELDRRALWRLGTWGAASVGAVIVAMLANQSGIGLRRDQVAAADLVRQSQQIQSVAMESQNETRRLTSAIDTLNGDRDRLYSRVTVLEQGLDSVTGAIARQSSAAGPQSPAAQAATAEPQASVQNPAPAPTVGPVAATPAMPADNKAPVAVAEAAPATTASVAQKDSNPPAAMPLMASKSLMAPPDAAAGKLIEPEPRASAVTTSAIPDVVAAAPSPEDAEHDTSAATSPKIAVQRTEFGVDLGTANSIPGLRTLWRRLLESNNTLTNLRPIIVVKEANNGHGMQLRLVAGPLSDAAAAARICAGLIGAQRNCETAVFEGQRLAMKADEPPAAAKPAPHKRNVAKHAADDESAKKPESSAMSSFFSRR